VGLILNAGLIDVFEASKVAETLWILLGVVIGGLSLTLPKHVVYMQNLKKVLSSHFFLLLVLCILVFVVFGGGLTNFFVADDFTWLKWGATAHPGDIARWFYDAQGFFYRPLAKIIMFVMYSVFSFQPVGYHTIGLFVHFFIGVGIYLLGMALFKKKLWAWTLSAVYLILPVHSEVLFWISTLSISWSTLFMVYGLVAYVYWRQKQSRAFYILSLLLGILSLFTYEMGVVLPVLLFITDVFLLKKKLTKNTVISVVPFVIFDGMYLFIRSTAHVAALGGDYSYSISHLIPNFIANYTNYLLASFIGEKVVAWQFAVRQVAKMHALWVGLGLVSMLVVVVLACYTLWKKVDTDLLRFVLFGFLFAFIALLPFLGLGNLSERYSYLGSLGFVFVVVALLHTVVQKAKKNLSIKIAIAVVGIVFFLYAKNAITSELSQWNKASAATYSALAYFRVVKEYMPSHATLYISHMPTRYGNAWIFPVGFDDGLWFVYRDDSIKVVKTKDVDESLAIKHSHPSIILNNEYVFDFDKDYQLLEY
jgi:hypothetical protein